MAQTSSTPLIKTSGLEKKFGSFTALNGVDLEIYPGEVHALLGDNGAGKSTLIKILSGVHAPTDGSIEIEGKSVQFNSPRDASDAGIGTVYQDLALNALTSVTRNFFLGREITSFNSPFGLMKMKEMREKSIADLDELLIETRKKQFGMRMQTGFGQEARASEIRAARKDVARIKTLLTELRNGGGS